MTKKPKSGRGPHAFPIVPEGAGDPVPRRTTGKTRQTKSGTQRPARAKRSLAGARNLPGLDDPASKGDLEIIPGTSPRRRTWRWGRLLLSSVAALVSLAIGLAAADLIDALFARGTWLGWAGSALLALAVVAALAITLREAISLARLKTVARIRADSESAYALRDLDAAQRASSALKRLYRNRKDRSWALARYREHETETVDKLDLLALAERELVMPLDRDAQKIVADTAKRVSLITALAPGAVLDIVVVAAANMVMLRKLAVGYGGRPGFVGLMRLARMVAAHLAMTGGIALGDNVLQQILGHGLTAKLSAKLGQGMLNGVLTARIGLAAIDLSRPLPYHEAKRANLNNVLGNIISFGGGSEDETPAKSPSMADDTDGKDDRAAARSGDAHNGDKA